MTGPTETPDGPAGSGRPGPRVCLILNARSGGGVSQPVVRAYAEQRGWDVRQVGPGADPLALAGAAEADVLVAAGGDGTISAVAQVAVGRDLPLVVVPCGTRNHFAADIGLDPTRPEAALVAVDDGVERSVDVGSVNGRLFLNNVSIGPYSSVVQDPRYRNHRVAVLMRYVFRAALGGGEPLTLSLTTGPRVQLPAHVLTLLIANNAYSPGVAPGPALRPRLDEGMLWVHVLGVDDRHGPVLGRFVRTAASILVGSAKVAAWPTATQLVGCDRPRVRIGIDGEAATLDAPLEFVSRPGALRLLTPSRAAAVPVSIQLRL